jgi:hypothetical protein
MKLIPLPDGKFTQVDDADFEWLMQWNWRLGGHGYALRNVKGNYGKSIYMHREIMGTPTGMDTDHINGDKLDNRRSNLRICNRGRNIINAPKHKGNKTSVFKGVSLHRHTGKWEAYINVDKKRIYLGLYPTPEEAARVYDAAALNIYGEFARPNFKLAQGEI